MRRLLSAAVFFSLCLCLASCQPFPNPGGDTGRNPAAGNDGSGSRNYDVMDRGPVRGGVLSLFTTAPDTLNPILTGNSYVSDSN